MQRLREAGSANGPGLACGTGSAGLGLGRELPDRWPSGLPGLRPVAGESVEHDPVRLDADDLAVVDHQRAGIFQAQEAVLRMDAEELLRRSTEPVRFHTMLVDEGQRVRPHRGPSSRGQVAARRGVLGQALDLVAPGGDGGWKVGHGREVRPNDCRNEVARRGAWPDGLE